MLRGRRKVKSVSGRVAAARVPRRNFHASFGFDALGRPVAPVAAAEAAVPGAGEAVTVAAVAQADAEELYYKSLYLPEQGMFAELPANPRLGTRLPVLQPLTPTCRQQHAPAGSPTCLHDRAL